MSICVQEENHTVLVLMQMAKTWTLELLVASKVILVILDLGERNELECWQVWIGACHCQCLLKHLLLGQQLYPRAQIEEKKFENGESKVNQANIIQFVLPATFAVAKLKIHYVEYSAMCNCALREYNGKSEHCIFISDMKEYQWYMFKIKGTQISLPKFCYLTPWFNIFADNELTCKIF